MPNIGSEYWHALPAEDAIKLLGADAQKGLDLFEIENRIQRYGKNALTEKKGKGPVIRFLLQVHQPLIYILILSGVVTAILKEWVDSAVIFGIVIINAIIGYVQESKALTAIAALKRSLISEATVVRAGQKVRISSSDLVPGDIVLLQSGDKVPADMLLIQSRDLQVDESALTGESVPVQKEIKTLARGTPLAERKNMAYTSTLVTYGTAAGMVVATGDSTEIGRISEMIASADVLATPLTKKIERFSHWLLIAIMVMAAGTLAIGVVRGHSLFDTFMAAVALAVGAIPEGLPAAVTIILAIGVSKMAKRKTIIRRLPAVETLGSTTVICTDKTGTLTKNQMTVQEIIADDKSYEVSGAGYQPEGEITFGGSAVDMSKSFSIVECLKCGILCNDSALVQEGDGWKVHGDPTEGALFVSAAKGGLNSETVAEEFPRLDAIPFESQHQYMATLHRGEHENIIYIKGSAEKLLPRCKSRMRSSGEAAAVDVDQIESEVERLARNGLRILMFASKKVDSTKTAIDHSDIDDGLTLLGVQGMIDPPRPEAIQAVAACHKAGVNVKMITGDHAVTAFSISRRLGIVEGDDFNALTSKDLDHLSDAELIDVAEKTDVFARMSPEQKFRLVEALQARGNVIAMTGDGVNDAPALRRADIGVAMGMGGTEVAREASDMVITDDNFASIEAAVEEGRGVFDNLLKFIVWTLPANLGEGLVLMFAILLGIAIPILPVQILWINMTTAGCLGLMYAFEPKEADIMDRKPRDPRKPLLSASTIVRITWVSFLLCIGSFWLYHWALADGLSQAQARTIAVNVFVVGELFYLFSCRSLTRSLFAVGFFSNMWVWLGVAISVVLQLLFTYTALMNRLFHTAPFGPVEWVKIIAVGSIISLAVGVDKLINHLIMRCLTRSAS